MASAGWGPDWYGDAALSYFNPLFSGPPFPSNGGSNFGYFYNTAVNSLIAQARQAARPEAAAIWAQADQAVMKDAPIYPITSPLQPPSTPVRAQRGVHPGDPELRPGERLAELARQQLNGSR